MGKGEAADSFSMIQSAMSKELKVHEVIKMQPEELVSIDPRAVYSTHLEGSKSADV